MKKIKLFAPLIGVSLTCVAGMAAVSCSPDNTNTIKVSLDKDVENIALTTNPENPVKGKKLVITLTANENYTIVPTSILVMSDGKKLDASTEMSQDNVVATITIKKEHVNSDMVVIAEATASEDGKTHNYLSNDGEFVPYVATHSVYSGSTSFDSEAQVFKQYMTDACGDYEIIEDDYLFDFNKSFGEWYTQITTAGGTFEALEAKIKIENVVFDSKDGIYKLTGHAYNKIVFTIPQAGTHEQSVDTSFTNAYIDYGAYEVESEVWDRTVGCSYEQAVYYKPAVFDLTDWKVEGQGTTQAGKEIVGSFTYQNWESEEEPGTINTDLSYLCLALDIHSPHYMSSVAYIEP